MRAKPETAPKPRFHKSQRDFTGWQPRELTQNSEIVLSEQSAILKEVVADEYKGEFSAEQIAHVSAMMPEQLRPIFDFLQVPDEDRAVQAQACAEALLANLQGRAQGKPILGPHTRRAAAEGRPPELQPAAVKWKDRAEVQWEAGERSGTEPTPVEFLRKFYKDQIDSRALEHLGQLRPIDRGLHSKLMQWLDAGKALPKDVEVPRTKFDLTSQLIEQRHSPDADSMTSEERRRARYAESQRKIRTAARP